MDTKNIIYDLRTKNGLSQDELAEKVFVTRQAVSRWETGETVPNTETLKLLSSLFDVSINTLLGSPRRLVCQCCGMPLEDTLIGRNKDGSLNENYCKWCYADGTYTYSNMDDLIEVCVPNMVSEQFSEELFRVGRKLFACSLRRARKDLPLAGFVAQEKAVFLLELRDFKRRFHPFLKQREDFVVDFVHLRAIFA